MEGKTDFEGKDGEEEEFEEEEKVDPLTLAPDLFEACKSNDTERIRKYIDDGVPFTHTDPDNGWSCLHWASCHGNVQAVKALLKAGAAREYLEAAADVRNFLAVGGGGGGGADDGEGGGGGGWEPAPALVNTPLHWAAYKGHVRALWVLLQEGYGPNDRDEMGNTPVHLAASGGRDRALRILLEDGGDPHARNKYRNTPLEVATTEAGRELLDAAMASPAPDRKQAEAMHRRNLEGFLVVEQALRGAMAEAARHAAQEQQGGGGGEAKGGEGKGEEEEEEEGKGGQGQGQGGGTGLLERADLVRAAADAAEAAAVDADLVADARVLVDRLLLQEELRKKVEAVGSQSPVLTQTAYTTLINPLSSLAARAEEAEVSPALCRAARFLVGRGHSEYWLQVALGRLRAVDCAGEDQVRDMARLKESLRKAAAAGGDEGLVGEARARHAKLSADLELGRARGAYPEVRVPPDAPREGEEPPPPLPKDFWQPSDVGHILVDEHFPLLPPEATEYAWVPSEALKAFRGAHDRLAAALEKGREAGAHEGALEEAGATLKAQGQILAKLEEKDAEDFAAAKTVAEKAAKKLKKKGKGKKKK